MSETDPPQETEETALDTEIPSADLAEIADLPESPLVDEDFGPEPKIKDYLQSLDAPSRYLMILSLLFGILAVSCFILLILQYLSQRHAAKKVQPAPVLETFKPEESFHTDLGEFVIDWENSEMRAELSVECSAAETCEQLNGRLAEARDAIIPVLQESSGQEILNPDYKQHLKDAMTDKLNELKLKGTIIQVNFTDLTVEPHH